MIWYLTLLALTAACGASCISLGVYCVSATHRRAWGSFLIGFGILGMFITAVLLLRL